MSTDPISCEVCEMDRCENEDICREIYHLREQVEELQEQVKNLLEIVESLQETGV